jgi:hypothetical protein
MDEKDRSDIDVAIRVHGLNACPPAVKVSPFVESKTPVVRIRERIVNCDNYKIEYRKEFCNTEQIKTEESDNNDNHNKIVPELVLSLTPESSFYPEINKICQDNSYDRAESDTEDKNAETTAPLLIKQYEKQFFEDLPLKDSHQSFNYVEQKSKTSHY